MRNIGFIGAGNMAGAIIAGILDSGVLPASGVHVYDINADARARYGAAGHPVHGSAVELVAACDTIVLAVKPQNFPDVLPLVKEAMTPDKLLVSIAAGIGAAYIQKGVGFPCKLILVMPNTPLLVGAGASSLSRVEPCTAAEFEEFRRLLARGGVAEELPPDKMPVGMAVQGTTPAYIYLFAKAVVDCAEAAGIDRETANRLFCQTLVGSAKMMTETGKTHQELIDMVCSPGGTTLAGMAALENAGFTDALKAAFDASIRRAGELAL